MNSNLGFTAVAVVCMLVAAPTGYAAEHSDHGSSGHASSGKKGPAYKGGTTSESRRSEGHRGAGHGIPSVGGSKSVENDIFHDSSGKGPGYKGGTEGAASHDDGNDSGHESDDGSAHSH